EVFFLREQMARRKSRRSRIHDRVRFVINDFLKVLRRKAEEMADLIWQRTEIPNMHHGHGELDVPEALAPHGFRRHLDTAPVADNAFVANAFVFSAITFPI